MKKLIYIVITIIFIVSACSKENVENKNSKSNISTNNGAKVSPAQLIKFAKAMGFEIKAGRTYKIRWHQGWLSETIIAWGLYQKKECKPASQICDVISVEEIGVSVGKKGESSIFTKDENGIIGLDVDFPVINEYFEGAFFFFEKGDIYENQRAMVFAVDITKIGSYKSMFSEALFKVTNKILIDPIIAEKCNISPESQFIYPGNYDLIEVDNILMFSIPIEN